MRVKLITVKTRDNGRHKFVDAKFSVENDILIIEDNDGVICFPLCNVLFYGWTDKEVET